MQKLITALLAAITLMGVGSFAQPAAAAGAGEGQYYDRRHDDRYNRYDRYRDYRYDRRHGRYYRRGDYYRRPTGWQRHVRRCERAYRTYNRHTDMYWTRYGGWRRCRL